MRIVIDLVGKHDPALPYMVVNNRGTLIDLSGLGGPANEPGVSHILYDDAARDSAGQVGVITRMQPGVGVVGTQPLYELGPLQAYLDAFERVMG